MRAPGSARYLPDVGLALEWPTVVAYAGPVRRVVGGFVCLALVAAPAGTEAAVKRGVDPKRGVAMKLDGRVLTVRILGRRGPYRVEPDRTLDLSGRKVQAGCGRSFRHRALTLRRRVWPSGRRVARFRFKRDVSRRARFCLLEYAEQDATGHDIATATFIRPEPRRLATSGTAPSGSQWQLSARLGRLGEPCVRLSADDFRPPEFCLENFALAGILLGLGEGIATCGSDTYLYGAVNPRAASVTLRETDGALHDLPLVDPPPGSRAKLRFFALALPPAIGLKRLRVTGAGGETLGSEEMSTVLSGKCRREVSPNEIGPARIADSRVMRIRVALATA